MPVYVDNKKWKAGDGPGAGRWGGLERIDINVDNPKRVDSTCMFYEDHPPTKYQVTTCCRKGQNEHVVEYHIHYTEEGNEHLLGDHGWGTHILILDDNKDSGESIWIRKPNGQDQEWKGRGPGWKLKKLFEERNHRRSHQQERDAMFRPQIIAFDEQCVITGERTMEALDAAHIIPAADNGNEIPENGIALRADIHRLYDAGKFFINPETGKPEIDPDLQSEEYREILDQGQLPEHTLVRVREALRERWKRRPK